MIDVDYNPPVARDWPFRSVVLLIPLLAFLQGFSNTSVFHSRDLSAYQWPWYQYLAACFQSGNLPYWQPDFGLGYPLMADASTQPWMPVTVFLRLALPDALGFNLWIALAPSVGALGTYRFARRIASPQAAAVAALAFSLSGPVLALGNLPVIAWSTALIGWVVTAAADLAARPTALRFSILAALIALQALAGEPVTLIGTAIVAVLWPIACSSESLNNRLRAASGILLAGLAGALLAAVQLLPLLDLATRSVRGAAEFHDSWWLHPLALAEVVCPAAWGSYFDHAAQASPWLPVLNSGREPLLVSLYVGVPVLTLAAIGTFCGEPWKVRLFWSAVSLFALVLALGPVTPLHSLARTVAPGTGFLRYPVKYALLADFALAPLAAVGCDTLLRGLVSRTRVAVLGVVGTFAAMAVAWLALAHSFTARAWLAMSVGGDPATLVPWLSGAATSNGVRLLVVCGATVAALLASWRRPAATGAVLGALLCIDLLAAGLHLNPVLPVDRLGPPAWLTRLEKEGGGRLYIPDRGMLARTDVDRAALVIPPELSRPELLSLYHATFPLMPAAYGHGEAISADMSQLRPADYTRAVDQFHKSPRAARMEFLRRAGVRYFVAGGLPLPDAEPVTEIPDMTPLAVWRLPSAPVRVSVASEALVVEDPATRVRALFDPAFVTESTVLLASPPPPPAGQAGATPRTAAVITTEEAERVEVAVAVAEPEGGYLLLRDGWDPYWRATVDGADAQVLQADSLFRAVRVAAGEHRVVFTYRPTPGYAGAWLSALTAAVLLLVPGWAWWRHRQPTVPDGAAA